jgi:agmatinase
MHRPPEYDRAQPAQFGGALPEPRAYADSAAILLPVPFERTTSYGTGTRFGPRELLLASAQVELWDEEVGVDVHSRGLCTLPEMELSSLPMDAALAAIGRAAGTILDADKFLITLGGEHSITSPIVGAAAKRFPGVGVLQIDAHADLRDRYLGERHSHACAMRRTLEHAPAVQVGIRNMSAEEAEVLPTLRSTVFYDWNMRDNPDWIARVVDALPRQVYITIDLDGLEPGLMPAVGTPEPGGLTWRELTQLLRRVFHARDVVACDVVELCPIPGLAAPNFVAARLTYKLLTYKFARR